MSDLKQLVPPLELCKQIPEGNFTATALVWCGDTFYQNIYVLPRACGGCIKKDVNIAAAPTLEEILTALEDIGFHYPTAFKQNGTWQVNCTSCKNGFHDPDLQDSSDMDNAATAALKLWLQLITSQKIITNADAIRQMSTDELTEFLIKNTGCINCVYNVTAHALSSKCNYPDKTVVPDCKNGIKSWLNSPKVKKNEL